MEGHDGSMDRKGSCLLLELQILMLACIIEECYYAIVFVPRGLLACS